MPSRGQQRGRASRLAAIVLVALVGVSGAVIAVVVDRSSTESANDVAATPELTVGSTPRTTPTSRALAPGAPDRLPRDQQDGLGAADGVVPAGVTVFDDAYPAVAKLHPALLGALREAAAVAARDGITLDVDSGWRSPKYQEQLLEQAIAKYGSRGEALRWVAPPNKSAHVAGDAVDIGPAKAAAWLSDHGARYGLCQIYRNEPWHYELRAAAPDDGCPRMYADPTDDPRMQS